MSVAPTSGTAPTTTPAPETTYVTITQPDGTTYRLPQAKATWDPATKSWVATPSQEALDLAKRVNSQASNKMDGDMFIKLLVAQLKYQDPSKPMDTAAMMQQTASLAMVERMNEMSTNVDNMVKATQSLAETEKEMATAYVSMLMEQRMNSGVSLVGRTVTYADAKNPETKITGVVESVRFDKTGPILSVDGKDVPLTAVVAVKAAGAPDGTPTTPAPNPSGSTNQTTGSTGGTGSTPGDTGTPGTGTDAPAAPGDTGTPSTATSTA
ncbi:flagellar basal-body rod modification protein FlgD [Kineosphaera limosa]|uniref:Basal-body rod modification protein FlgD n=1 Tax=Kineosphaera limosa NBRC 100340 TaxID=1184609 RepID=K6XHL1_9MICO|nr:flagellar hook capping FlgD N-terminal domain-containing protein [Kineosphaera limosa]NYD99817.1 flagellar basal-body rod modification protein FlgD [Kineosphaera limosa]GAB98294.1 putative flagellar basal-body rod modification protein FlgD [Kineosphaera limosa NBRC 100340]